MSRQTRGSNTGRKAAEQSQITEGQLQNAINHFESTNKPTKNYDKNRGHYSTIVVMAAGLGIISPTELKNDFNAPKLFSAAKNSEPTGDLIASDDRSALTRLIKQRLG